MPQAPACDEDVRDGRQAHELPDQSVLVPMTKPIVLEVQKPVGSCLY